MLRNFVGDDSGGFGEAKFIRLCDLRGKLRRRRRCLGFFYCSLFYRWRNVESYLCGVLVMRSIMI